MGNGRIRNGSPAGWGTMVTYFPLRFPSGPAQTWDPFLPLTPWLSGASAGTGGKTLHPRRSQTAAAGKGRKEMAALGQGVSSGASRQFGVSPAGPCALQWDVRPVPARRQGN